MPKVPPMPTSEVAAQLGIDVRTVHRKVASGEIVPLFKAPGLRGAYMFDPADVEALIAQRAEKASA